MPELLQFGYEHFLYLATDGATLPKPEKITTITSTTAGAGDTSGVNRTGIEFEEFPTIRDSGDEGNPNTIDVSSREELRTGVQAQAITSTAYSRNFQIRYKPGRNRGAAKGSPNRDRMLFELLAACQADSVEICLMELDDKFATGVGDNAWGFAGNFTVSLSTPRPQNDLVVVDVTATATTLFHSVRYDATNNKFVGAKLDTE